ncbi:MAG: hypothetical protein FWD47_06845 [Treponema sp.]|nr:hypothetical protein [Treponema sp.]
MSDIEEKKEVLSTAKLSRLGVTAIIYFVIGIFLLLVTIIPSENVFGFVVGGLVLLFGLCSFVSKEPTDRKVGIILVLVGALTLASKMNIPAISRISKILLIIGASFIIIISIYNSVKFFIGLKRRS